MSNTRHANNGKCPRCQEIFSRYPSFHAPLRDWFNALQADHPEAHISCAGRGELDQEAAVINKTSRAHWGESAHNFNAAIDIFEQQGDKTNIYEREWFEKVVKPRLKNWLKWYGAPGSEFNELPHVEARDWKILAKKGVLQLVS